MFKVPDWEDGMPKQNISFKIRTNKKRNVASASTTKTKSTNSTIKIPNSTVKGPNSTKKSSTRQFKSPTRSANKKSNINKSSISIKKSKTRKKPIKNEVQSKSKDQQKETITNIDTDKLDEAILNAKKKKFNDALKNDDIEHVLFKEETNSPRTKKLLDNRRKLTLKNAIDKQKSSVNILWQNKDKKLNGQVDKKSKEDKKKERLKQMLESNRTKITVRGNQLRERMLERLKSAQFRYLNEKLYTSSGSEAKSLFQSDPTAFQTYHQGYQQQVKKWPVNPLDVIVKRIMKMPKTHTIADMGCGSAALSTRVPHAVRGFDLVACSPAVEACDMAHTPLLAASVHAAVYCLALMGTDLTQYLLEANRVLIMGGHLLIAEVESRFDNVDQFTKNVEKLGFKLKHLDKSNNVFFFMEFVKTGNPPVKKSKLPVMTLKPCLYKKR